MRWNHSRASKRPLPTHVPLRSTPGLWKDSVILLEQVRTIDRSRLRAYIGHLPPDTLQRVNQALVVSLGMEENTASAPQMCMSL